MACRVHKRISLRRKLHILRALTNSNSGKRSSIAKSSSIIQIYRLKVALETIKRDYENLLATRSQYLSLLNHVQVQDDKEVKVEKVGEGAFVVRVKCEKGGDKLVAVLEALDDMCLNVEKARVSCDNGFSLEAIATSTGTSTHLDGRHVTEALLKAIGKKQISTAQQKDSIGKGKAS